MNQFDLSFEWDPDKATANLRKHGVSFERAVTVFRDPNLLWFYDEEHSHDEDRWITLGMDRIAAIVIVCHTTREDETDPSAIRVRIISARRATLSESRQYEEQR